MKITIDMPTVDACDAIGCSYNVGRACHARAITVGHGIHPGCDTYVTTGQHVPEDGARAGVGACKVDICRHNQDLECSAGSIRVGVAPAGVECTTFEKR